MWALVGLPPVYRVITNEPAFWALRFGAQIYDEAMRIIRLSDEVRVKVARVPKEPAGDPPPDEAPTCPKCNEIMVIRTAKTGTNAGETFWGCSTFPKCWVRRPLETA